MAIYMLLLDRWRSSSMHADLRTLKRQSEITRCKSPLRALRDHKSFQRTESTSLDESKELIKPSKIGKIASIDEGVEDDLQSSNTSQIICRSGKLPSSDSIVSSPSPFESFDSQIESDIMSSISSCHSSGIL